MKAARWTQFRWLLGLSAAWLTGYAIYRYTLFNPPDHGTVYGIIFPLALVLAVTGFVLAWRPAALYREGGWGAASLKVGLTGFGLVWMGTGVHCTLSFLEGIAAAPLGGTLDMIHMLSDHVFLPAAVVALAWAPDRVARRLGAASADEGVASSSLPPEPGSGALHEHVGAGARV
ncbi:MAG: hypothetical protein KY453_12525 [Gemmatimonadetes bacterium]|nr:hypothetical protein [Gemmatimonadota bacterium]